MAAEDRYPAPGVVAAILADGAAFSFFQVVRVLEGFLGTEVGGARATTEALRFQPDPAFVFPRAGVERVEDVSHEGESRRFLVTTSFLGLYGTTSPLPMHVSEDVLLFDGERDGARDLMDVLNHRVISLYYRAWAKYRHYVGWKLGGSDPISKQLFAFCGLGDQVVRENLGVPAVRMLRYAGLLSQMPRSAAALRGILADYFNDVSCRVQQCILRWVRVDVADRWLIGKQHGRLGESATVGSRVADRMGKLRIVFGPTDLTTFMSFVPTGDRFAAAAAIARFVVPDNLDFDIEVQLQNSDIPPAELQPEQGPRLGWTSWLGDMQGRDGVVVFPVPAIAPPTPEPAATEARP